MSGHSRLTRESASHLRRQLRDLGYGQAESEDPERFARRFFPVPEHLRALDPGVVLIVGARGAGKTELFRAFFQHREVIEAARRWAGERAAGRIPMENATWRAAYPIGAAFPHHRALRVIDTDARAREFWYVMLVRRLRDEFLPDERGELQRLLDPPATSLAEILRVAAELGARPTGALDALNHRLADKDHHVFLGYDELDTLGGYEWPLMVRLVGGLVGFWSEYARRWPRIRPKIFLRSDLFRRHAGMGTADFAKLAANRAELHWSEAALLGMLAKRIANTSPELFEYCSARTTKLRFDRDDALGAVPEVNRPEDVHPLIERMAGTFMGAGHKKGYVKNWILDHLRDGNGQIAPRTLVRLFEQAATKDALNRTARPPRLLHPTALRQALEDVSNDHVRQGISSEWPWLAGVRHRLEGRALVPWDRDEVVGLLDSRWDETWAERDGDELRPPEKDARSLVQYLVELGVFRERTDGRIDVPDIYLFGLGLRRKGGVKVGKKPPRRSRR